MQNKNEYVVTLEKAIKYLIKYKKSLKTRQAIQEINKTIEILNGLYFEIKRG